jgi:hypothetical protein
MYLFFFAIIEDLTFGLSKKLTNAVLDTFLGKVAYSAFYTLSPTDAEPLCLKIPLRNRHS